jgi:hypothetical protein
MPRFVHSVKAGQSYGAKKYVHMCVGFDGDAPGSDCKSYVLPSLTLWASVFSWLCAISEWYELKTRFPDLQLCTSYASTVSHGIFVLNRVSSRANTSCSA